MLLGQTDQRLPARGRRASPTCWSDVHDVPGLRRLRFTTSHPEHVDERMADAFRDLPRLCPYLHLPVQSGSDRSWNRCAAATRAPSTCETVALLRGRRPTSRLSSDIIVGYPGETRPTSRPRSTSSRGRLRRALRVPLLAPSGHHGAAPRRTTCRRREAPALPRAERCAAGRQGRRNAERVGTREEVIVDTVARTGAPRAGRRTSASSTATEHGAAREDGRRRDRGRGRNALQGIPARQASRADGVAL
jgi:tRNA-2-methylthio-N6-dimethylallyladenosine synthase